MKTKRYLFWKKVKTFAESKMQDEHLKCRGSDSACPRCKKWESQGNTIYTEALEGDTDKRTCTNCEHEWLAIFTPVGFIPVEGDVK